MHTTDPAPCSRAYYLAIARDAIAASRTAIGSSNGAAWLRIASIAMTMASAAPRVAS